MQGSGRSQGWLVHLMAGAALGAVAVLVVWIFSGGRPFGEVVGTSDVRPPTAATPRPAGVATPAKRASRLASRPPALEQDGDATAGELRFTKPKAKRAAEAERRIATRRPRRAERRKRAGRGPVVRVVAPPAEERPADVTPVVVAPSPAPTAAPKPASPPPSGAGGGSAKPKPPGPTLWAGEG